MADAHGSGPCDSNIMRVQVPFPAYLKTALSKYDSAVFFCIFHTSPAYDKLTNLKGFFMSPKYSKRIAIIGREKQTINYRRALEHFHTDYEVTLSVGRLSEFDGLLLPGGGDIDPHLLNAPDTGSRNIDTELDIIQFQALDLFAKNQKPILGICKGFQLINLYFGAELIQDLPSPSIHPVTKEGTDSYHEVTSLSFQAHPILRSHSLPHFPRKITVNSAHHQGIVKNGKSLFPFQTAPDGITEAFMHEELPILAFQWHPERMLFSDNTDYQESGRLAFDLFFSLFIS